jgi:ADP-ribose pyrophosphatase YjhB (NUDIX family)
MSRIDPELPIPGVAAVTVRGSEVLLAERGKPPSLGKWGIPGGAVEIGETREEVRHHYILFEYLCEYVSGEVLPGTDAPDARWVSIDDLGSVNIMPYTRRFIERVLTERGLL